MYQQYFSTGSMININKIVQNQLSRGRTRFHSLCYDFKSTSPRLRRWANWNKQQFFISSNVVWQETFFMKNCQKSFSVKIHVLYNNNNMKIIELSLSFFGCLEVGWLANLTSSSLLNTKKFPRLLLKLQRTAPTSKEDEIRNFGWVSIRHKNYSSHWWKTQS